MTSVILVTGATGFVGRSLVPYLLDKGMTVHATCRGGQDQIKSKELTLHQNLKWFGIGDDGGFKWGSALEGVDIVIHLMGRAHILDKSERKNKTAFDRVNVEGMRSLLDEITNKGVKRLINLGTIGVHGETSDLAPISEFTELNPQSPYARSKLTSEQLITQYVDNSNLTAITLRAPLIYGVEASGNFKRLMNWITVGYPMPFLWVTNKRSLLSIDNLLSAIWSLLDANREESKAYVISDGESIALPEIVLALASGMGRKPRLWGFPTGILSHLVKAVGGSSMENGLLGSLEVNCNKLQREVGWSPKKSTIVGLEEIGRRYRVLN